MVDATQWMSGFHAFRDESPTAYALSPIKEAVVTENWHEERDRLIKLLEGIGSGKITHIDEKELRQLQATNPENVALLRERLAKLNARLGEDLPTQREA